LDGEVVAKALRQKVADEIKSLRYRPCLATILVGDDPASALYVDKKQKACQEVGIDTKFYKISNQPPSTEIESVVHRLNKNYDIHGILIQLPLPSHIDQFRIFDIISPNKDVDGFTTENLATLIQGRPRLVPCTPLAVLELLKYYEVDLIGKHVVIINDSLVVGRPLSALLLNNGATVTVCNVKTKNLPDISSTADVIVTAVGHRPKFILTKEYCKRGVTIIDVGINRSGNKVVGDVDVESVSGTASAVTKVPGGVGPNTISFLLSNVLKAYKEG
jgi:methylenetetrahydrofolate dehydrogenase (NADP+)/methenyltetrahydrofolate cyclohydrolase